MVNNENLASFIKTLSSIDGLIQQVSEKGSGSYLYLKIKQQKQIGIVPLMEYIILEEQGRAVEEFIKKELGNVELIEHFQAFFRYRLKSKTSLGKIFGQFQANKKRLSIQQYSIKQATV